MWCFFFFQAEDGIRDLTVTGVQTCALPIYFGAARQTLVREGQRLSPMYTPGFAPPEQYKNRELLGPWSDCYAIGASIFACLASAAPQAADDRSEKDRYVSATKVWNGKYSRQLLETIDWCREYLPFHTFVAET